MKSEGRYVRKLLACAGHRHPLRTRSNQTRTTNIGEYETHHNIGSSMRGTAILVKDGITLTNVTKLPSGRTIAAEYRGTLLINIYAPFGTVKRHEREYFFNNELPYLLRPPNSQDDNKW